MADLTGRCACGAVRWTSPGPILWAGHCHCESCRRATSAPFTSFFGVPRATARITGPLAERWTSDRQVRRQHCPACGSQITYQFTGWPDHGVPENSLPLLSFVRRSSESNREVDSPIIVQCR